MKSTQLDPLSIATLCCRALDNKQAGDLRVLDVGELSSITDYLVVGTGNSEPHLRALRVEVEKILDAARVYLVGMDAERDSGWMVIDAFDVMVHLFLPEHRERYGLENLWRDAKELNVDALLKPPVAAKKKKSLGKAAVPKRKTIEKKAAPREKPQASKTKAPKRGQKE